MIHIKVLNAENLPLVFGQPTKTKLYFFSLSSMRYMNYVTKCSENTANPTFDADVYVPFYRCRLLSFSIYSSKLLKDDIFIGRVDIDLLQFLSQNSAQNIYIYPFGPIKQRFLIISSQSSNSYLTIEFSFMTAPYQQINFEKIKSDYFHVFTTYSPPLKINYSQISEPPVEIELFQSFPVFQTDEDKKKRIQNGVYFTLNKENSWDEVGFSTMKNFVVCPTGISQIQTFNLQSINGKAEVLILNVFDYTGTVTLHFVAEKKGKFESFSDDDYFLSKSSDNKIFEFRKIDVNVEKNKKYIVPLCIIYMYPRIFGGQTLNNFPLFSCQKSDDNYQTQILNEILKISPSQMVSFQNIEKSNWKSCHFFKTYVIPSSQKVSLSKILNEFQLPPNMKFSIYIGGSAKNFRNNFTFSGYWTPTFLVFDSKSRSRCSELENSLVSEANMRNSNPAVNYFRKQIFGLIWTFCVDFDLDKIDSNKVIILCVKTGSSLDNCFPPGSLTIVDSNKGNLLFRKQINVSAKNVKFATCLRFQFSEDGWDFVPMFEFFQDELQMTSAVDELYKNNWNVDKSLSKRVIDAGIIE